jgi:[acyl-carrier-protein] S-malonyltransferase
LSQKKSFLFEAHCAKPLSSFSCDRDVYFQPAIYVASLAAVEALRSESNGQEIIDSVDVACGLSLGEYTALAFAGVFR